MAGGIAITAAMLNTDGVTAVLKNLSGKQAASACSKAINDAAFHVRKTYQSEMRRKFDRVTPYIERAPRVKRATPGQLSATIDLSDGGGKGIEPAKILHAQTFGGRRNDKRSEVMLRKVGILPAGYQAAIPTNPFPGSEDGHGNIRGPFMVQLLAYFQSFSEVGSHKNMKARAKANLHAGGTRSKRAKVVGPTLGRRYFVSYGKLRGGARMTAKGEYDERASNLPPGIWAVVGSTGAVVKPVLMFVRRPSYTARLSLEDVNRAAGTQDYLDRRVRFRVREAAGI